MTSYIVVTRDGRTEIISAYCESDAYQQAAEFAGDEGILEFGEM